MCSIFIPSVMDNYQGDLTDIVRASGGAYGGSSNSSSTSSLAEAATQHHHHQWHHHQDFSSDPMSFSSHPRLGNHFGDPFSTMRDPFLQELDVPSSVSSYFNITTTYTTNSGGLEQVASAATTTTGFGVGVGGVANTNTSTTTTTTSVFAHKAVEDDMMRRSCKNIFSNMIQISPNAKLPYDSSTMAASPRAIKPSAVLSPNMINNANASKDCLVDNTGGGGGGVQISSPRNPGPKRRKNQAKKVVCIPAPAAANSRQTGEVVPSDLWAWRKYGQKPIKGSPYPRGYYRCSSSKGCSARKQVERSRTDPNMLVITYTSEHNHPWPTQRNALAGSTRSQPSKSNAASKNSEKGTSKPKEEQHESNSEGNNSPLVASVKEEMEDIEKQLEMDEGQFSDGLSYKPSMINEGNQSEDFFAELGEIEADPLNLLFTQGFGAGEDQRESKALDPFHLFDWSGGDTNNTKSFEEPNNKT